MKGYRASIQPASSLWVRAAISMVTPTRVSPVPAFILALLLVSSVSADDKLLVGNSNRGDESLETAVRESVKLATAIPVLDNIGGSVDSSSTTSSTTKSSSSTSTTTTPNTTATTTVLPIHTHGPSRDVEYKMSLSYSGPAVLDSAIWFNVELIPQVDNTSISNWTTQFIYQWMNMANKAMNRTEDLRMSSLTMTFHSKKVKAGRYPMTVAAFLKDNPARLVAFQTHIFVLTEKLNGQLVLYQDLAFQRFPNVFATNMKLNLRAQVHDRFHKSPKPTFEYFWYKGGKFITSTEQPTVDTRVREPTNITVKSVIYLSFENDDEDWEGGLPTVGDDPLKPVTGSNLLEGDGLPEDMSEVPDYFPISSQDGLSPNLKNSSNLPFKKGNFDAPALFKDELTSCTMARTDKAGFAVETQTTAIIQVSCLGSPPLAVCLNITKPNTTITPAKVCRPLEFLNETSHTISITLNTSGWQDIHFFIYNDVSRVALVQSFYGYTQDSTNILPLTLPVVFGLLGLVVILIGAAYIMRLRKKPLVEVADFDFHPTLTSRLRDSNSITLSRMFNSLKYFLFAKDKPIKDEINFPAEMSPTPTEFSPTPTDFSHSPLSESFKSETEHSLYGSL